MVAHKPILAHLPCCEHLLDAPETCCTLQKLNGCFDLAVVILVAVLSDSKEDKSLLILRKIN